MIRGCDCKGFGVGIFFFTLNANSLGILRKKYSKSLAVVSYIFMGMIIIQPGDDFYFFF